MDRKHDKYERIIARCKSLAPVPTALAHPCDQLMIARHTRHLLDQIP